MILLTIHCAIIYNKYLYRNINKNKYHFSSSDIKVIIVEIIKCKYGFFNAYLKLILYYSTRKEKKVNWQRKFLTYWNVERLWFMWKIKKFNTSYNRIAFLEKKPEKCAFIKRYQNCNISLLLNNGNDNKLFSKIGNN